MKKISNLCKVILILSVAMILTIIFENKIFATNYENQIEDEKDLIKSEEVTPEMLNASSDIEQAGNLLRQGVTNFQKEVYISFKSDTKYDTVQLYDAIKQEAIKHTGNPKEGDYIRWLGYSIENTEEREVLGSYYYIFTYNIIFDEMQKEKEREIDSIIADLITKLNLNQGTDYEKIKKIYSYVCNNISPNIVDGQTVYSSENNPVYEALKDKKADERGFANLIYRLALECGVDCRVIWGSTSYHPYWNIVKIGDLYYNLDAFTDSGKQKYKCFLISEPNATKLNYKYTKGSLSNPTITDDKYLMAASDYETIKDKAEVVQINGVWRLVQNGTINYNYTGLGTNSLGTWFVKDGTINFNYTGTYKNEDGKIYYIEKNKVMTDVTKVVNINNVWTMVKAGIVDYAYTGFANNEYGTWYVKNGIVDLKTRETYVENEKAYIIEGNRVVKTVTPDTTEVMQINGIWRMVENGEVKYNYTGFGTNSFGIWFVKNGEITFNYTGTFEDTDSTIYYIENNKTTPNLTKVVNINNVWTMVKAGIVDYAYTGFANNEYGTWYVKNGIVDLKTRETYIEDGRAYIIEGNRIVKTVTPDTTEVMQINGIWRMVKNGEVKYDYTGFGTNSFGTWFVKDGTINFNYTGTFEDTDSTIYYIENNKTTPNLTKVININNVWTMVKAGIVDYAYTGFANNEYGTWYVKNGIVDLKTRETYVEDEKAYIIEGNRIVKTVSPDTTEVMQINGIWRMVENGEVKYDYTGIGQNSFGKWYVKDGEVNFNYSGKYTDVEGNNYNIQNGKVIV